MGRATIGILIALSVLSCTSGSHKFSLVPDGKELVYDYKALVKAGTAVPASYASEFFLNGKVHVQCVDNTAFVKFSDLKYKLYNGERHYEHEHDAQEVEVPQDAADILKVFKIIYDDNGQAKAIGYDKDEKVYARNMHKALANTLQLHLEKIRLDDKKSHAFTTEEHSIYGKTVASYNVLHRKDDTVVVQKMHEMKTTKPMYFSMITTMQPDYCEAHYEEPMSHDSHQYYHIHKLDGHYVVKHIESTGGVYIYPLQAKSEFQYIHTNITLNLKDVVPVTKAFQVASEHVEEDLTYDVVDPAVELVFADITNGRRVVEVEKYIPAIETMLQDLVEWLHENHIHMREPEIKHGQLVNRLVRALRFFDKTSLEHLYTTVSAKTTPEAKKHLEIIHQVLPLVGTHAAAFLVKELVQEKKVEDYVAMHMLHSLPRHIRAPSEKFLQEMEVMLTWGDKVHPHVHKAAVLCFSSLIHKTFQLQKKLAQGHQHHHHHDEHDHVNMHVSGTHQYSYVPEDVKKFLTEHKIYDKYVTQFVEKVKSSQSYDVRMLYLQALYNTKLHSVVDHLVPIVQGEEIKEHKVRLLSMWAIAPMVAGDFEKVFELYWPIFSDWEQHLELRMAAYFIIMESHPPITRLFNIFWEMQAERSVELYHFHYNYLVAMSRSTDPCHHVMRLNTAQLLKFTRRPNNYGVSTYYQMDYIDKIFRFGGDLRAALMATDTSKMFALEINNQMFNIRSNYFNFFVRIDGLKETIHDKLHLNLDSTTELFNYDEIFNFVKSLQDLKDVHVELSYGYDNQIVQTYYYDSSNIKNIYELFKFFHDDQFNFAKNWMEIHYEQLTQIAFPTEIGLPALMDIVVPSVHHRHFNIHKEVANNIITINVDNQHHISRHSRYGLSFYNPIADVFQGINRYHSYDLVFPIYADITINTQQHSMKISWKRHDEEEKNIMGLRSHATSMVFVKDDLHHDVLTKSCPKCKAFDVVTKGEGYRHNYTMIDHECYNTGYHVHGAVYDSEIHASKGGLHHLWDIVGKSYSKNYVTPVGHFMLFLRNWHALVLLQPSPGTHGIFFKISPSTEVPVTHIDVNLRVNKEYAEDKETYLPGAKITTRITYGLKNKEKAVKTWDVNGSFDLNPGHTQKNVKIDVTRVVPSQKDFKVSMESTKKWTFTGVTGHLNVVMGPSTDGKFDKDVTTIDVEAVASQLEEQKTPFHVYEVCQPYTHHVGVDYHSMRCLAAHTTVRKYVYDVKSSNVPNEYKKTFFGVFDYFRQMYKSHYQYDDDHEEKVEENNMKVVIVYPTQGQQMDLKVVTPIVTHEFTGVPTRSLAFWGFRPDNTHFSRMYMMMHHMGLTDTCVVRPHQVEHGVEDHHKHVKAFQVPTEYTVFAGDVEKDVKHGILVKKTDVAGHDMMALKIVHDTHFIEVYPKGEHAEDYKIVVDGKEISQVVDYHTEDWFTVMVRPHRHGVVITSHHTHAHIEHLGDHIYVEIPKVSGVQYHGHCVAH